MTISDESIPRGVETHVCIDKAELAELRRRAALYEEHKPKQWWGMPKSSVTLFGDGSISQLSRPEHNVFGLGFTSTEQAEEAKPLIRSHNRLIRYVQEHGGIQEFVLGERNWTVTSQAEVINYQDTPLTNTIFMSLICAKSLAAGMKDKSIIL